MLFWFRQTPREQLSLLHFFAAQVRSPYRMAEAPEGEMVPEGAMAGRSKPAPLRTTELGKPPDPSMDSSPVGAALMARKAERQKDPSLQSSMASPDGGCDSPGWQTNFSRIREEDSGLRQNNSSPQGSALLRKKIERQHHGEPVPRSGELQQPARRPQQFLPGSDQLQPPLPLQK